jgi:hypothetical protein
MRFALCIVVVLAGSLHAQIAAELHRYSARSSEIEVRNESTLGLMAFAVTMSPAPGNPDPAPFVMYADIVVDQTTMPLAHGEKFAIPLPARFLSGRQREDLFIPPILVAGIFSDGATAGDPTLVNRIILRRRNMLQAVELAQTILADAGRRNVPRAQLTAQFQNLADSLNHWYLPEEQQVGRALYQSLAGKLLNVPDLKFGDPFPPTTLVEQETAALSRRRTMLMESQPSLAR